jgi:Tol biopolymer transport system component
VVVEREAAGLLLVGVDGRETQLTENPYDNNAQWSPRDSLLVFENTDDSSLHLISPETEKRMQVYRAAESNVISLADPAWSPSGDYILAVESATQPEQESQIQGPSAKRAPRMVILKRDGAVHSVVTLDDDGGSRVRPFWVGNSDVILFGRAQNGSFQAWDVRRSAPSSVVLPAPTNAVTCTSTAGRVYCIEVNPAGVTQLTQLDSSKQSTWKLIPGTERIMSVHARSFDKALLGVTATDSLILIDDDSGTVSTVAMNIETASISPDGGWLAAIVHTAESLRIQVEIRPFP